MMRRANGSWLGPLLGFFLGALAVSVLGGALMVGLLVGGLSALLWHPLQRQPLWTQRGRAHWVSRVRLWLSWLKLGVSLGAKVRFERRTEVWQAGDARMGQRYDAVFRVRCELVGERFEVWHSLETGRAYEVMPQDSFPVAEPGVEGWLSFDRGRPRVQPLESGNSRERLLN
jgi:hypothetical protein